ncbi:hypothetical protein QUF80_04215 [Desulfococcaceae bacterium HSG8]|nr:hypothetical protein [Desulfococcaceae bacterium HSG8]
MMKFSSGSEWLVISLIFFGIIFYISWRRWQDRKWIQKRFAGREVRAMSFGVSYFGRETDPGAPRCNSGFLLLLSDGIFYRSRSAGVELEIPIPGVRRVYPDTRHKGVNLNRSVIRVEFEYEENQADTATFSVPYPPQWIRAIRKSLQGGIP